MISHNNVKDFIRNATKVRLNIQPNFISDKIQLNEAGHEGKTLLYYNGFLYNLFHCPNLIIQYI